MSLRIKTFVFNAFQVNTYIIMHDNLECLLVDPACYSEKEQEQLAGFIGENGLKVQGVINTHCHIDHVLGNSFVYKRFGVKPKIHREGLMFFNHLVPQANTFGFEMEEVVFPGDFLEDGDEIMLGNEVIRVAYTPGHADGSICLVHEKGRWLIAGDLLFQMSIGRTDLPSGNLEKLLQSVKKKVFIYDDDFVIYPGHGDPTTIGFERRNNPYL